MATLLLGITLTLWGLQLLGVFTVGSTLLGIFAFITGILYIVSALGGPSVSLPTNRRE